MISIRSSQALVEVLKLLLLIPRSRLSLIASLSSKSSLTSQALLKMMLSGVGKNKVDIIVSYGTRRATSWSRSSAQLNGDCAMACRDTKKEEGNETSWIADFSHCYPMFNNIIKLLLFCPSWSCTIIRIIFTSLCKNLVKLTRVLAEAFRCHVHHFQCLAGLVELPQGPSSIENDAHGIEKLLLKL